MSITRRYRPNIADRITRQQCSSRGYESIPQRKLYAYCLEKEMEDLRNMYHIIYHHDQAAGFCKIIFNFPHPNIQSKSVSKLERLYLLKEFYSLGLGYELLQFNIELSKQNNQDGLWLYVWKGNDRAIRFYEKIGFTIIGSHDFRFTQTHSNPNHQMFLKY